MHSSMLFCLLLCCAFTAAVPAQATRQIDDYFDYLEYPNINADSLASSNLHIQYRGLNLSLSVQPNTHLFARNYTSEHTVNFYSGTVDNLPNSFVSLHYKRSGVVEGTIHLGNDLGSLHIDSLAKYDQSGMLVKRTMALYHTADLIPQAERERRRLRKRQDNTPLTMDAVEYIKRITTAMTRFLRLETRITRDGIFGIVNSNTLEKRQQRTPTTMDATEYMHRIVVALTRYLRLRPTIIRDGTDGISNGNNFVAPTLSIDTMPSDAPVVADSTTNANALDTALMGPTANTTAPALSKRQSYVTDDGSGQQQIYTSDPNSYPQTDPSTGQPYYDPNAVQPQPVQAAPQNVCVMSLIADYSFYQHHGEDSESVMMGHVASISQYYQQQIGISMAVSFVYIARGGDDYGFNAIPNDADTIVPYINAAAAKIPGMDAENMCVIAAFSSTDLSDGAVGVSYVGTVCQPGGQVLIIQDRGGVMAGAEMTAIVMHEVGHSFGAAHDDPNGQCDPTPGGESHFVMYPVVSRCRDMHTLSSCSLSAIQTNLQKPEAQCWAAQTRGRSGYRSQRVVHSNQQVIWN